jgi:HK97 family phage major capsid protein
MSLERARLLAQAEELIQKKPFTREDSSRADSLLRLAEAMVPQAALEEARQAKMANRERELSGRELDCDYDRAFYRWLRDPSSGGVQELRRVLKMDSRYTAQATTTDTRGGELVPQGFEVALLEIIKQSDPLYAAATPVPTGRGNAFAHPAIDDPDGEAEIVAENATAPDGPVAFGAVNWGACPKWSSGWALVPIELLQDSAYDIPTVLAGVFGKRIARGVGRYFTTKVLSAATTGVTTSSPTAITGDNVLDLMGSVDPIYAAKGSWLMNFSTYLSVLKLKASTGGDYLFPAAVDTDGTPLLVGRRVLISPTMPAIQASAKAIAYGDVSGFLRREVTGSMRLGVARERWIERGQLGFQSSVRIDGEMILSANPSDTNSPIKVMVQHS